jgi:hypothetical protein
VQNVRAQLPNSTADKIADSLIQSGLDTVIIYKPYRCLNGFSPTDTSYVEDLVYLVTKKADVLTIVRCTWERSFLNGRSFETHKLFKKTDSLRIFDYLSVHFKSVVSDTLLPGLLRYRIDNKDTLIRNIGAHPCHTVIAIRTISETLQNGMIDLDLTEGVTFNVDGTFREKVSSVNYAYNISTSIYKMIGLLEAQMLSIEQEYLQR